MFKNFENKVKYLINDIGVKEGDIVNVKGNMFLLSNIIHGITGCKEGHSAMIIHVDKVENKIIIGEATYRIRTWSLEEYINEPFNIYRVYSTEQIRKRASIELLNYSGLKYSYLGLIGYYVNLLKARPMTPNKYIKFDDNNDPTTLFCSIAVARAYYEAFKYFGVRHLNFRKGKHWTNLCPADIGYFSNITKQLYCEIEDTKL